MRFSRRTVHDGLECEEPLRARTLQEIDILPGDAILSFHDDGTPYGVCGAVFATQADPSRQITYSQGEFNHDPKAT